MREKKYKYYCIGNSAFNGTFQGDWSDLWNDTELTDLEEAKELFKRAKEGWTNDVFETHHVEEICLYLNEIIVPIDEDGDFLEEKKDANTLEKVCFQKKTKRS